MRVEEAEAVTMRFYRGIPGIKIKLRRRGGIWLIGIRRMHREVVSGAPGEFKNHRLKVEKEGWEFGKHREISEEHNEWPA